MVRVGPGIVKIFGRGKEEKQRRQELAFNVGIATAQGRAQGRAMSTQTRQQINSLGGAYFLQEDENFLVLVSQWFPQLYPFFSRLNSTGQIKNKRQKERLELLLERALLKAEMFLDDDEYYDFKKQLLGAMYYYGLNRISDAEDGYRGTLVTETRERTYVEAGETKKRGWL